MAFQKICVSLTIAQEDQIWNLSMIKIRWINCAFSFGQDFNFIWATVLILKQRNTLPIRSWSVKVVENLIFARFLSNLCCLFNNIVVDVAAVWTSVIACCLVNLLFKEAVKVI